ncbi:aquaporin transporter [Holotrichia oblita]|uniref:Aquaporin transporter n=1 Tax=Holotrichia oblita TaxID=644536 RepID=A0ACB9SZF0_HOLOL|nr:aquaporin transporter [Holotrichia oblita]
MRITNKDAENVRVFERKIIRRIYGPKKINEDQYQRLTNQEIRETLNGYAIVKEIKSKRIRWYGHINRKDEELITRKITKWKPQESEPKGRPQLRWEDQVANDVRAMGITE